jgi:hypothetical protein
MNPLCQTFECSARNRPAHEPCTSTSSSLSSLVLAALEAVDVAVPELDWIWLGLLFEASAWGLVLRRVSLLPRAAVSFGSSMVTNTAHVISRNFRSSWPSITVTDSMMANVDSVCKRSFASACHCASRNSNVITISLCGLGRRPSKTGMAH